MPTTDVGSRRRRTEPEPGIAQLNDRVARVNHGGPSQALGREFDGTCLEEAIRGVVSALVLEPKQSGNFNRAAGLVYSARREFGDDQSIGRDRRVEIVQLARSIEADTQSRE